VFALVSQAQSTTTYTLGAALERDRLEHRVSRIAAAITVLRHLESDHRREPPRHIPQTIADFEAQTKAMKARLRELSEHHAPSASHAVVWHTHTGALDGR
jgi:hypothetical protein